MKFCTSRSWSNHEMGNFFWSLSKLRDLTQKRLSQQQHDAWSKRMQNRKKLPIKLPSQAHMWLHWYQVVFLCPPPVPYPRWPSLRHSPVESLFCCRFCSATTSSAGPTTLAQSRHSIVCAWVVDHRQSRALPAAPEFRYDLAYSSFDGTRSLCPSRR